MRPRVLPDFSIELLNGGEIEPGLVAHHWLIKEPVRERHSRSKVPQQFAWKGIRSGDQIRFLIQFDRHDDFRVVIFWTYLREH